MLLLFINSLSEPHVSEHVDPSIGRKVTVGDDVGPRLTVGNNDTVGGDVGDGLVDDNENDNDDENENERDSDNDGGDDVATPPPLQSFLPTADQHMSSSHSQQPTARHCFLLNF